MRLRTTAPVLALTALTLPGCSSSHSSPAPVAASTASARPTATTSPKPAAPVTSAALGRRLLDENDLGQGYTRKPDADSQRDDVTVVGCPALDTLGSAAASGSLDFPNQAKASFTYTDGSDSELTEELYSDREAKLSQVTGRLFNAMTSCPSYQIVVGSTPIQMSTRRLSAPQLGDEQWSQLLTFTINGRSTVMKQTVIRTGTIVVDISGSPGLVDTQVAKALKKAQIGR
ncbi:hypothetical protein [Streptomyces noursei]|uniref:hypothetical protein n=1 Tax=Streptomyces noursei TaxID=1971 RepID=UPI00380599B2